MTEQTKITPQHKSISAALAAAQMQMGPALKQSINPAFKSKYADLASVLDACLPALNAHGIAVIQPTFDDDAGRWVKTIFLHDSGETLECRVPLIVSKNDMQGYGSAVTYARRYGLMSMAGIAPEDDDGNAAAKAAPASETKEAPKAQGRDPRAVADSLLAAIGKCASAASLRTLNEDGQKFALAWQWLEDEHEPMALEVKAAFDKRTLDLGGDEIPY